MNQFIIFSNTNKINSFLVKNQERERQREGKAQRTCSVSKFFLNFGISRSFFYFSLSSFFSLSTSPGQLGTDPLIDRVWRQSRLSHSRVPRFPFLTCFGVCTSFSLFSFLPVQSNLTLLPPTNSVLPSSCLPLNPQKWPKTRRQTTTRSRWTRWIRGIRISNRHRRLLKLEAPPALRLPTTPCSLFYRTAVRPF